MQVLSGWRTRMTALFRTVHFGELGMLITGTVLFDRSNDAVTDAGSALP
jgi:hypothetical protein